MHATAMAADPGVIYWNETTLRCMLAVRRMRAEGLPGYFTMDAGPHVKVITTAAHVVAVEAVVGAVEGVLRTIVAEPGGPARLEQLEGEPAR